MFKSEKTKQLIGYFLSMSCGVMNYTKLLKLMYIVDRKSLIERGFPITYDSYCSMDNGPVLSKTYDEIKHTNQRGTSLHCEWRDSIHRSDESQYDVKWVGELKTGKLSQADKKIVDSVWEEYGHMTYGQLIDLVHTFDEWENPQGSSKPIEYEKLLSVIGYDKEEAEEIAKEIVSDESMEAYLKCL